MSPLLLDTNPTTASEDRARGAEAILAAVVFGARNFMNADWTGVLDAWLERLGRATGSGQVRIFANDATAPGEPTSTSLCAQWLAPGATGSPMEALQRFPYRVSGCARWEE